MASTTSIPLEQAQVRPSFAKVAASAYKPHNTKDNAPSAIPPVATPQSPAHACNTNPSAPNNGDAPKVHVERSDEGEPKEKTGNTASRTGQWANATAEQVVLHAGSKEDEREKTRPSIALVKFSAAEDSTTQLSSSDGSAKPPSLDGKSVASGTTFALDEKESIRPDDSASLRAVEEEDVASPPGSVVADSRGGSDSGIGRAFRDQLHEIAVCGPQPHRGVPPGRFPNPNASGTHALFDPNQPLNSINRPMSQPLTTGMPSVAGPINLPALPDEKLIEALQSPRDRLFVVKLEQDFIDFIKDSRENEFSLPNCNTFYRMLAHRLADYYLLGHVVDSTMTGVKITRTQYCRIPPPLSQILDSSKSTNTPPVDLPARKIMRRGDDGKSGTNTAANSENPSKTTSEVDGSDGGNEASEGAAKDKSAMTREEREARYREARQRIFGSVESEENENAEAGGSGEEKDASRSSSASGKKKSKKQRNYDDDGFEARSRFNAYYPQQFSAGGFTGDNTVYYNGFPGQMQTPPYPGMIPNASPPPAYSNGYPVMIPHDAQSQYGWPGQQYQPPNGSMAYPNYGPMQNGYDLSAEFQRGMQFNGSAGIPSQVTPKMANVPMASYQDTYQPQPQQMPMNPGWSQMNQPPSFPMGQAPYTQNGPGNRPMSAPIQGPVPGSYPYGQLPPSPYNGKPNHLQHPVPGSFNRQQFNPQSQAFVPGGRNMPFQMPSMQQSPAQGMNGYSNFQMPVAAQMPNQLPRPSPPIAQLPTFGSPRSVQQTPQIASSQTAPAFQNLSQQSSIAKWGTPSHLPPKPPAPVQQKPPQFSLPGHGFPRVPNSIAPGFMANAPMTRGGVVGPNASNNN